MRNKPLARTDAGTGYYFHASGRTNQSEDMIVALAFSGGGTRAAAFAYGVLEELRDTKMPGMTNRSMLSEVDVISAVSGGSVTAAAYGLYGERVFDILEPAFLTRNVQRRLVLQSLNPLRWPWLWAPTYGRSELAADNLDRTLFHGATFETLRTNGSPFIVINGTDITTGARFDFTQHSFDLIESDVTKYPLASAVAASSAVPGALTPVTLENFAIHGSGELPDWIIGALDGDNGRLRRRAVQLSTFADAGTIPYVHVVDGGVCDNIGVQPYIDYVQSIPFSKARREDVAGLRARKAVLIVVNAFASPEKDWQAHEKPPGSITTAVAAASHTLDQRSQDTVDHLKEGLFELRKKLTLPSDVKLYVIHLSFTNYRDLKQRRFFLNLPTSFFLPGTDVTRLREAGKELLRDDPTFQELLKDLGTGTPPALVLP
ncbi:MAG TPA: patatin-like phospholipase family protein [Roseimicrobium sp.]|nr:patatin-like phospholipase family protein [Roseimicrobium sp.]